MTIFHHDVLSLIPVSTRSRKRDYLPKFVYAKNHTNTSTQEDNNNLYEYLVKRIGFAACVGLSQNQLLIKVGESTVIHDIDIVCFHKN